MANWNINNIDKQEGKVFVITGATSGLGKEAARVFTQKGGTVLMAIRNLKKGQEVIDEIKKEVPNGLISMKQLDLSSLT